MLPFAPYDTGRDPDPADGPDGFDELGTVSATDGTGWRVFCGPRRLASIRGLRLVRDTPEAGPALVPLVAGGSYLERHERFVRPGVELEAILKQVAVDLHPAVPLGRSLFLGTDLQLRRPGEPAAFEVVLSPGGLGWWRTLTDGTTPRRQAPFRLPEIPKARLCAEPAENLLAWLLELDEETCQLAFARRFLALSRDERTRYLWQGDVAEVKRVLQLALLALSPQFSGVGEHGLLWRIELDALGSGVNPAALSGDGDGDNEPARAELRAAFDLVLARLGFRLLRANRRCACVDELWYSLYFSDLRCYLHAPRPRTTLDRLGLVLGDVRAIPTGEQLVAAATAAWQAWLRETEATNQA